MVKYYCDEEERFVIEGYDKSKTFSSFLPGIARVNGIPMWVFYVNRGQGICSFGIRDKNSPIMEFSPASIAYSNVNVKGFRTFIKIDDDTIYEPFSNFPSKQKTTRKMFIKQNELSIEEINEDLGLKTNVIYFTMPFESFAGLVRKVEMTNVGNRDMEIEVLDGMPEIIPFGVENSTYKEVGNLMRSWMEVYNLENNIPFFKVRASTKDEARVDEITRGHFYLSFSDSETLITPIVDFELIFEQNTSLLYPDGFVKNTVDDLIGKEQITANKVPCGFTGVKRKLEADEKLNIATIIGHIEDIDIINKRSNEICKFDYIHEKRKQASELVTDITDDIHTETSSKVFDAYCRQNYLDNILRGGYPLILDNKKEGFVYHVYSRKHGDLERDYNFFTLEPEYYSQGNGNFRDVNQNRRNDIFFNPKIRDYNVKTFMNLIQADGYNPLSVKGCTFEIIKANKEKAFDIVDKYFISHKEEIKELISSKFTPGKIINYIYNHNVKRNISDEELLIELLSLSTQNIEADFGEGYWIDHWTYNMDLIESYLKIYPDKLEELLFDNNTYKFYDSPAYVLPRSKKYVLANNKVRQYDSIMLDEEKIEKLNMKSQGTNWLKTNHGQGEVYCTNLFVKLITLSLVKFATLDPYGMGIEMEADKPGWNDAMNGLPGLFGSGMSETFELKRIIQFIIETVDEVKDRKISLPIEVYDLLYKVNDVLEEYNRKNIDDFNYWDKISTLREEYRQKIRFGFDGREKDISLSEIAKIYNKFLEKLDNGINKALKLGNGLFPTYFYFEAEDYEVIKDKVVKIKSFKVNTLPYFLEGPARALKTIKDVEDSRRIYDEIKKTDIFDKKIKMYKTSVSLENQSYEIGRIKAFTPGWLERESVFLHMEYKYLLELIKSGLYDEFFEDIKTCMIPFLSPEIYGRSILENSSFIASSVNPDSSNHGRGFVARLSGSTAEFISMWAIMMMGNEVFKVENGNLVLKLKPILPNWLFNQEGKITFKFLGKINVTYHNNTNKNTYGDNKAQIKRIVLTTNDDDTIEIEQSYISAPFAEQCRDGAIKEIDIYFE
ncbi:hypothetical protein [Caldisalinibacter kiritimatiensis]|uniref:Cellobiose phosphorylase n=1 Tax=Caldisalinibacter kiritimatiensis TaxID=1304284 RepID=R1AUN4_9FIRM|nr:hypothetical protein [Caldisalinibacter kiritimatiensis]EOD00352.1 hypothetical protein L21TH_1590 [Caldisalinibacter kiritimatiensis]